MLSDIIKSCFEKAQGQQNAEGYTYQAQAWIRYHLSSWDWCTLPLWYLWTGFYHSELVCWRSSSIIFFLNWFFSLRSFQENQICLWVNIFQISLQSHSTFAQSPMIRLPYRSWTRQKVGTREWASAENRQKLAYIILIELLAYLFFFASPVRWIQTQDLLFTISARTGLGSSRSDGVLLLVSFDVHTSHLQSDFLTKAGQGKKWEQENELVPRTTESLPILSSSNYLPIFFFLLRLSVGSRPKFSYSLSQQELD